MRGGRRVRACIAADGVMMRGFQDIQHELLGRECPLDMLSVHVRLVSKSSRQLFVHVLFFPSTYRYCLIKFQRCGR